MYMEATGQDTAVPETTVSSRFRHSHVFSALLQKSAVAKHFVALSTNAVSLHFDLSLLIRADLLTMTSYRVMLKDSYKHARAGCYN